MPYKEWRSSIQKLYLSGQKNPNKHFFNEGKMQKDLVLNSGIYSYVLSKKYESYNPIIFPSNRLGKRLIQNLVAT